MSSNIDLISKFPTYNTSDNSLTFECQDSQSTKRSWWGSVTSRGYISMKCLPNVDRGSFNCEHPSLGDLECIAMLGVATTSSSILSYYQFTKKVDVISALQCIKNAPKL